MHCSLLLLLAAATAAPALPAQKLAGVTFLGFLVEVDVATGQATSSPALLAGGLQVNGSTRLRDGQLLLATRSATTFGLMRHSELRLVGQPFASATLPDDLRGLATNAAGVVFGVRNEAAGDRLVRIDAVALTVAAASPRLTGFDGLQALAPRGANTCWAWDTNAGLVSINTLTGVGSDPFPAVATGGADIQFLTVLPDGRLIGGRNALFDIDTNTGVATAIGSGGYADLRAGELLLGTNESFGTACAGAGGPVTLVVQQPFVLLSQPTSQLLMTSGNHAAGAIGVGIVGLSKTVHQGSPLPFPLDALLGTVGCSLYASIDLTMLGLCDVQGQLATPLTMSPVLAGFELHLQHAVFENVPGGTSWSQGVSVRLGVL